MGVNWSTATSSGSISRIRKWTTRTGRKEKSTSAQEKAASLGKNLSWQAQGGPGEKDGWGGRVKIGQEPRPTGQSWSWPARGGRVKYTRLEGENVRM